MSCQMNQFFWSLKETARLVYPLKTGTGWSAVAYSASSQIRPGEQRLKEMGMLYRWLKKTAYHGKNREKPVFSDRPTPTPEKRILAEAAAFGEGEGKY